MGMDAFFSQRSVVLAHRGLPMEYPENTEISFRKAIEIGVDVIETDVHLTLDGELVVFHDDRVDRTTNGNGLISEMTLKDLKKLDAGYKYTSDNITFPYRNKGLEILTLREMLEIFPEQRFNLDIKDNNIAAAHKMGEVLQSCSADERVIVGSQYRKNLIYLRELLPDLVTSYAMWEFVWIFALYRSGFLYFKKNYKINVMQIPLVIAGIPIVTANFVEAMHERNIKVQVWTVNSRTEMHRLLGMGVDGIFTDDARLLIEVSTECDNTDMIS